MKIEQANKLINKHEKEDLPALRSQLETNTIEINNLKNTKVENKNGQGYKITDPLINSYSQEVQTRKQ